MTVFIYSNLNDPLKSLLKSELDEHVVLFFDSEVLETSKKDFLEADILMGNPPKDWFERQHARLKFWQLDSAGFDQYKNVKTDAVVANMGDFFSLNCAETIVSGILGFYRGLPELARLQDQKKWVGKPLRYKMDRLSGKQVVILGAGTIAQSTAQILTGFKCDIKFFARKNPVASIHSLDDLKKLHLPKADIVINSLPGSADKLVNEALLDTCKRGALYASIGRGNTTDEPALIQSILNGRIGAAVLDVTDSEPLPVSSPLWSMPNVILSQHTGGGHGEEDEGKVKKFLSNAKRFLKKEPIEDVVSLQEGY